MINKQINTNFKHVLSTKFLRNKMTRKNIIIGTYYL